MPQQEQVQQPGFGELFSTAAKQNWIFSAKQNSEDLMTYGTPVEGYKPTYDEVNKLKTDFKLTDEQSAILSGSLSPEELQYRAQVYKDKNDGQKTLEAAGWKGTAAEMLSYAADPTMLPTFAIKTPYVVGRALGAVGIQMSKTAVTGAIERAVGASIVGGATSLGQEAALSIYDPDRDVNDVVIAGLSGMVGAAAFSSLVDGGAAIAGKALAKRALGREMLDVVESTDWNAHLDLVNSADHNLNQAISGRLQSSSYSKYFKGLEGEIPDAVARKRVLTEGNAINKMIDDLLPTAEARMSRGDRLSLEANIKSGNHEMELLARRINEVESTIPTGSGKALSAARQSRSSELADLRNKLEQQRVAVEELRTTIEPHATGIHAQAVSDISRLKSGIIPDHLKEKYLDLITPEDAAPAYVEAKGNLPAKEEPQKVLPDEAARVEEETLSPTGDKTDTSIGAAEKKGAIIFPDTEGDLINSTMATSLAEMAKLGEKIPVTKAAGTTSIYGRVMAKMKDNSLRGIGALVFNDPHGAKTGIQSAVAFADTMRTRVMPKAVFIDEAARNEYIKAAGINPLLQAGKANDAIISFNREVALKINSLTDTKIAAGDDAITRAAKARAEAYRESLDMMKRYGVRGFEEVDERASYQPVIFGRNDITSALDTYGEDAVKEVLVRGYMGGKIPLSQKSAMVVADAMMDRFYRRTSSIVQSSSKPSISSRVAAVRDELIANGVPEKEIQTVINMLGDKSLDENISARAMKSLHPDITSETVDGLRFVDLMDTSIASVDKYVRDASAQSAFARNGLRSRRQVEDTITEAFKQHRQELSDLTNQYNDAVARKAKVREGVETPELDKIIKDYERLGNIGKYRKFLDDFEQDYFDGVKVAFGEPIEDANSLTTVGSAIGKMVNMTMLGFSGTAQVADLGVTVARSGLGASLRNLPTTVYHGVRSLLPSQKYFIGNNELSNLAEVMGTISHQDYLFGHKMMTGAEYGDAVIGHVSTADKVLDQINWVQSTMSFLRPMQGMIDELSARSLMTNVVQLSKGGSFTGKTRKAFLEIGKMDEANLDASLAHIHSQMSSGKDMYEAIRTLDPKLRDELGTAIRSIHTSNIGRSYFGELPAFTNKTMGKIFMKLQSFALVAYEKSIQRGVRNDMAGLVAATTFSAGIASVFIDADVRIQSLKMPESKRDEYVTKRTEEERAYTIAGRMSQVAMFSTLAQVYNIFNPYQESAMKPFGEYRGIAPMGAFGKIGQAGAAASRLASDQSVDPESDEYKIYNSIPLLNTAMGMAILNTL
ncbi:hypothetical protein 6939_0057 [Klebsiella phage 6939]|uniref:Internal virion protein n=1 Tax=Klebsiella phage 6939 TaxID=2912295 RepID=A0A9E7M6P5_9CAUD|nr:hypothetical protein 6939_0057 [Klebsiella phage 6939]